MSPSILLTLKKWPLVLDEVTSLLNRNPQYGETSTIDFFLHPPERGILSLIILVDGHEKLHCELCDTYPFLEVFRDWMEHCLVFDREGFLHPEIATIDCRNGVFHLAMIHAGWEVVASRPEPVSIFVALRSTAKSPPVCCFCLTYETMGLLYVRLKDCLRDNRQRFNSPSHWHDNLRYNGFIKGDTTDRLLDKLYSEKIERFSKRHIK